MVNTVIIKHQQLYDLWQSVIKNKSFIVKHLPEEILQGYTEEVARKRYEYVGTGKFLSNGQEKKKSLW